MTKRIKRTEELTAEEYDLHKRRRLEFPLPLGALMMADRDHLMGKYEGTDGTVKRKDEAFHRLLYREGHVPWNEVTTKRCMTWLPQEPGDIQQTCRRMLQKLLNMQMVLGVNVQEQLRDWNDYRIMEREQRDKEEQKRKAHNEQQIFSHGQCRQIVQSCLDLLKSGQDPTVGMAVLLILAYTLSEEEVCALDYGDLTGLRDYKSRLVVKVAKSSDKESGDKYYRCRPFDDPFKTRTLPLPTVVGWYYKQMERKAEKLVQKRAKLQNIKTLPLISNPSNRERRKSPKQLRNEIEEFLAPWQPTQITMGTKLKLPTTLELLKNTALHNLDQSGCGEQDQRRMRGMAPSETSSKHYQDHVGEDFLNRIGGQQDRIMDRFCQSEEFRWELVQQMGRRNSQVLAKEGKKRGSDGCWAVPDRSAKSHVTFCFYIKPLEPEELPAQNAVIQLGAMRGMNGCVTYEYRRWQSDC